MARKTKAASAATPVAPAAETALAHASNALAETLAKALNKPVVELRVGIRNISDNTIGFVSPFKEEPDLHLFGDVTPADQNPGRSTVISYAFWQILRKSKLMERGEIMRDDSILGASYTPAPPDRPVDMPISWATNAIVDPFEWVESFKHDDGAMRAAIARITNDSSLRRIRRVVDVRLRELEKTFGDDPERARKALEALPAILQMIDQVITMRLEA